METLETSLETIGTPRLSIGAKWKHKWKHFPKWKHLSHSTPTLTAAQAHAAPEASELLRV